MPWITRCSHKNVPPRNQERSPIYHGSEAISAGNNSPVLAVAQSTWRLNKSDYLFAARNIGASRDHQTHGFIVRIKDPTRNELRFTMESLECNSATEPNGCICDRHSRPAPMDGGPTLLAKEFLLAVAGHGKNC